MSFAVHKLNLRSESCPNVAKKVLEIIYADMTNDELLRYARKKQNVTPLENELLNRLEDRIYEDDDKDGDDT